MKIHVLLNIGSSVSDVPHLTEGDHDVSAEVGLKLIERGWAVSKEPPAARIKAVPPPAAIKGTPEAAAQEVKTYREKASRANEPKAPAHKEQ